MDSLGRSSSFSLGFIAKIQHTDTYLYIYVCTRKGGSTVLYISRARCSLAFKSKDTLLLPPPQPPGLFSSLGRSAGVVPFPYVLPVNDLPKLFQVRRLGVLVLQIHGMLPHVASQERDEALH